MKNKTAANLVGQRFGRLLVQVRDGNIGRGAAWLCRCECGKVTRASTGAIKSGHKRSCGCLNAEAVGLATSVGIAGSKFGRLTAISRVGSSSRGGALWACVCDCGTQKVVEAARLTSGNLISCGCARRDQPGLRPIEIRDRYAAYGSKRRAVKAGADGRFNESQISDLFQKQRGLCAWCEADLTGGFHRDHRRAISNGGSNDISNIQLVCQGCNLRKGALDEIEWAAKMGKLL